MNDLHQKAEALRQSGDLAGAARIYGDALKAAPDDAESRYRLGMIYGEQNNARDAVRELSASLQARPGFAAGWFELCGFAEQAGHYELSRFAGEQAVRLMPEDARAWLRYGIALSRMEREQDAIAAFQKALKLDPAQAKAWVNLAVTAKSIGRFDEAEQAIRKAMEILGQEIFEPGADEKNYGLLHWHLALLELLAGRYREGFAHFRARFYGGTDWQRFASAKPLWRGENLAGKTLLAMAEQGHGDALMLARYLPLLKAQGARIVFQAHPALACLFQGWDGADEIIAIGDALPESYDYHTAIFDLPYLFKTTLDTIPARMPYLPVPAPDAKTRLPASTRPKIGVVWAGQPDNIRGKNRSVPLAVFAEIFAGIDADFFSLTRDMRDGEAELLKQYPVTDLAPLINDFADSARFIGQMDLVISCDTATAHLAGGMGKPVWILLPFVADWRWARERSDNAWYPTARLFRQDGKDEWRGAVARVRAALHTFAGMTFYF